jgi:hypothetical protein
MKKTKNLLLFLKFFSPVFREPVAVETSSVPADFFPEVQTKVPSIEATPRPNNKDDAPAQARPSLGPVSLSSFATAATEGIKTTASVDDVTAVLPALESRDDDIVTTTAKEKDDDGSGHDIKREAVTAADKEDSDAVAQDAAVELEPAALIADEAAAVPDEEKSALKKSTPVVVVSSSARGFEPTSSNVGEAATPILPTTTVQKEAFPMPTSLPPDDLGRSWFGKIKQKDLLVLPFFCWLQCSTLFLWQSVNYLIFFYYLGKLYCIFGED